MPESFGWIKSHPPFDCPAIRKACQTSSPQRPPRNTYRNKSDYRTRTAAPGRQDRPLSARLERSRGWIVRQALSAWVDQQEERNRMPPKPWPNLKLDASWIIRQCRSALTVSAPILRYGSTLMKLSGPHRALSDLARLHELLASMNKPAATRIVQSLTALQTNPRIGRKLEEFEAREVRPYIN